MSDETRVLDEHRLRYALRLDAEELPPRLDPALIAAAARTRSDRSPDLPLVAGAAFVGGWLAAELSRFAIAAAASVLGVDPLAVAIQALTAVAVQAVPVTQVATSPAIPLAIAVVAALVIAFEQRRIRPA